MQTATFKQWYT